MNTHIYIVTEYGCNSSPSDMWTPHSKLFTDYKDAYEYFITVSPSIDETDVYYDTATHYINGKYDPNNTSTAYIVIENRCQTGEDGETNCAKRPRGAVIARCGTQGTQGTYGSPNPSLV